MMLDQLSPNHMLNQLNTSFDDGDSGWAAADGGAFVEDTQLGWGVTSNTNAKIGSTFIMIRHHWIYLVETEIQI